ncbi:cecropin-B isoform X1 [Anopheles stephensi]|uniref:cecropin-B isoform X1 n=1 Tax=Anopheles stephensi TaxID=30069 RepID=UPI001658B43C|nr:cecropin-B isoform X1 [Anopheles stephensi]
MNFTKLFILVAIAVLVIVGVQPVDGAPRWKFGKRKNLDVMCSGLLRKRCRSLPDTKHLDKWSGPELEPPSIKNHPLATIN